MADVKISQLPQASLPLAGTEVFPLVQSGTTVQAAVNSLSARTPTITTLRGLSPVNQQVIAVDGYYAAGDNGGGAFVGVTGALPGAYTDNGGTVIVPTGGDGSTAWLRIVSTFVSLVEFGADPTGVSDSTSAWNNFSAYSNGPKIIPAGTYLINSISYSYNTLCIDDNSQIFPPEIAPLGTQDRSVENSFIQTRGALRVGSSDTLPTNDERGYWYGLPSQNAWGSISDIGLFSVAFNRNGASYGTYTTTFGHDCVTYGTASIAGGAGSCTGDPANPSSSNFEGYCSLAFGKNTWAPGPKSVSLCEEGQSKARASVTMGYACVARETVVGDGSIAPIAIGYSCDASGEAAVAIGKWVTSTNGSKTIGSGVNPGSPLVNGAAGSIALGGNTVYAPFVVLAGTGTGANTDVGYTRFFSHSSRYVAPFSTSELTCGQITPVVTNSGGGGYGGLRFDCNINGSITSVCWVDSDSAIPSLLPTANGSRRLGSAALQWEYIFAVHALVVSDARDKQDVRNLTAKELAVAKKLKGLVRTFKLKSDVAKNNAKINIGVIAQEVVEAFASEGLNALDYGVVSNFEIERDGAPSDRYNVDYNQILAFIIAAI